MCKKVTCTAPNYQVIWGQTCATWKWSPYVRSVLCKTVIGMSVPLYSQCFLYVMSCNNCCHILCTTTYTLMCCLDMSVMYLLFLAWRAKTVIQDANDSCRTFSLIFVIQMDFWWMPNVCPSKHHYCEGLSWLLLFKWLKNKTTRNHLILSFVILEHKAVTNCSGNNCK